MLIIPEKWIRKPDEAQNGFLQAWAESGYVSVPIALETHGVALDEVTLDREQDFAFRAECDSEYDVFADEADFWRRCGQRYAPESFVPCGLLPPPGRKRFDLTARAIINGRVTAVIENPAAYGFAKDDALFVMTCLGYEFDAVVPAEAARGRKPAVGNYVSGLFWINGCPTAPRQKAG